MAREKKPKTKKEQAESMLEYTYRDMGQEYLMRKKMWRAVVIAVLLGIALIVFVALYMSERQVVQATYQLNYAKSLEIMLYDIDNYRNADGDLDLRYRMILSDASAASSFGFLIEDFDDEQKAMNELYTVLLKYPEQSQKRMEEIEVLISDVLETKDDAYKHIEEFVLDIDKKGY